MVFPRWSVGTSKNSSIVGRGGERIPTIEVNDLARPGGPDVLGYGAFDGICILQNRAVRLTQPTPGARSARTGSAGGMWV